MTERGTVLGGRYELDQIIGRGGMAEVWRARDRRLVRDVAVKRLRVDLASDPTFQARFRREAQSAAGLNHPNIVAVYDTGEEHDTKSDVSVPYIVMELVEGVTLRDVLRDGRKILPERALEFTRGVLDALSYSHRAGIIHRDIKPANVMLTPDGSVKVMDFGIARAVADTSATMTQTAAVIGTAQYLSPEQARGEKVDNRSDIYSVGCLLYELLVSQPPFKGDSPVSVAYQHVREIPVAPSTLDPEVTADMDAIVLKSLAKDPADRYQDAREFSDDVSRALRGEQVHAVAPVPASEAPTSVLTQAPAQTHVAQRAALPQTPASPVLALDDEDLEEEPKSRKGLIITLSSLAGLLVVGIIIGVWMIMNPGADEVPMTKVPNVIGWTEEGAVLEIESANLVPVVAYVEGTEENKDQVQQVDPGVGEEVQQGTEVTLTISQGPTTIKIPENILGMRESDAIRTLRELDFSDVAAVLDDPATEDINAVAGTVTAINPPVGAEVTADRKITLTIATGKSKVPSLEGMTRERAQEVAQDAGFPNLDFREEETADTPPGIVFSQNPTANGDLARGSTIVVLIAKAPADTRLPVPNFFDLGEEMARDLAEEGGWELEFLYEETVQQDPGEVWRQTPQAGELHDPLTQTITLTIAQAPPETEPSDTPTVSPDPTPTSTPPEDEEGEG